MKFNWKYWLCQFGGWGGWTMLNIFMAYQFGKDSFFKTPKDQQIYFLNLLFDFIGFVLGTHILRTILKRISYFRFSIERIVLLFIISVIGSSIFINYSVELLGNATGQSYVEYEKEKLLSKAESIEAEKNIKNTDYYLMKTLASGDSTDYKLFNSIKKSTGWSRDKKGKWQYDDDFRKGRELGSWITIFILVSLWLLIYLVWHYVQRNRKDQLDHLKLQATVKELELKTIKSHINPHFIFNALNSIRALVDENPSRARTAITELSNLLRSSMATEKMETVTLEKEIDIVKNYLALEQMRFEERLKVKFDIDEDTLDQPVPPMMIQTLVENAIKHGISKQILGGEITIISDFVDNHFEIRIRNTGVINGSINNDGFGIKSTQNRLQIMYGEKATFNIHQISDNEVEAKIVLPIKY